MRTNSIIPDPEPLTPTPQPKKKEVKATDWELLSNGADYKQVKEYLQGRITYFQRFLPSGIPVADLSKEQQMEQWGVATTIINEFEGLLKTLEAHKHNG